MKPFGTVGLASLFIVAALGCDGVDVDATKDASVVRQPAKTDALETAPSPLESVGADTMPVKLEHLSLGAAPNGTAGGIINPCYLVLKRFYERSLKKQDRFQIESTFSYTPKGATSEITKSFTLKLEKMIVDKEHVLTAKEAKKWVALTTSLNIADAPAGAAAKFKTTSEGFRRTSLGPENSNEVVAEAE